MKSLTRHLKNGVLIMLVLFSAQPLLAGDDDHDRARQAMEAGNILPLSTIIKQLERAYPGQFLEVELEHEDDRWLYEIKLMRDNGALIKLELDASNGEIIRIKGRDINAQEHH